MTQYGQPSSEPPSEPPSTPAGLPPRTHRGAAILTLGIIGLVTTFLGCGCCALVFPVSAGLSITAWVMANTDLAAIRAGQMDSAGLSTTQAGRICGIIGVILACLGVAMAIVMMVFQIGMGGMGGMSNWPTPATTPVP